MINKVEVEGCRRKERNVGGRRIAFVERVTPV